MNRANSLPPSTAVRNGSDTASADSTPKGRYKSVLLSPRRAPSTPTKLSPGFLHSFGFASKPSQSEPSEPPVKFTQESTRTECEVTSVQSSGLPTSALTTSASSISRPLGQKDSVKQKGNFVLSESQLNVMSHNLSEIADRVSPTKYDPGVAMEDLSETLVGRTDNRSETSAVNASEQSRNFRTPYSRKGGDSKSFASRQKSFKRNRTLDHASHQEMNNNRELSLEAGVNHISLRDMEPFKLDSETDSGYSSSLSTSISLGEEIKASKRLSLDSGSNTDVDVDESLLNHIGENLFKEKSAKQVSTENCTPSSLPNGLEERLDSLIQGLTITGSKESGIEPGNTSEKEVVSPDSTSTSFKLPVDESFNMVQGKFHAAEQSDALPDLGKSPPFQLTRGKDSTDDRGLSRTKSGRRPGLLRRRSTLVSFRPPKQMTVQDGESDIVEMDEAGFVQLLTDIKSLKTHLFKLKRELQEADVVSPLSHSHSCLVRRPSAPLASEPSLGRSHSSLGKRMLLKRTMTMDAGAMQERLSRGRSFSLNLDSNEENTEDVDKSAEERGVTRDTEQVQPTTAKETSSIESDKEAKNMSVELEEAKKELREISQERDSLVIQREELEHELDSKNHTIKLLQKQLEAQDNRDEMAYLKRQVKSLTEQIQQQQHKITELRFRTASPTHVPMGTGSTTFQQKKDSVKADIRNRLRDAFVRHLGESSKNHTQLSKHIQKAEQSISMAQKDKSGNSFKRINSQSSIDRSQDESDGRESESDSTKSSRWRKSSGSFDRSKRDSDGTDSESQSGKPSRRGTASPGFARDKKEVDGSASESDSGKGVRRWLTTPRLDHERSKVDSDGTDSESQSVKSSRRHTASSRVERDSKEVDGSASESDSSKGTRRWLTPRSKELNGRDCDSPSGASSRRRIATPGSERSTDKLSGRETDSVSAKPSKEHGTSSTPRARKTSRPKGTSKLDTPLLSHSWTPGTIEKIVKSWRETKSPESEEKSKEEEESLKPVAHVQFL